MNGNKYLSIAVILLAISIILSSVSGIIGVVKRNEIKDNLKEANERLSIFEDHLNYLDERDSYFEEQRRKTILDQEEWILFTIDKEIKLNNFKRGVVTNELQRRITELESNFEGETLIERVLRNNANEREYELDVYDCTEFAKEGVRRLKNYGIKAITKKVQVDCDSGYFNTSVCKGSNGWHLIIKIEDTYWEAVTGKLITEDKYKGYGLE